MENILKLVSKPTTSATARKDIVEFLKDALERAERGEIRSVFLLLENDDYTWEHYIRSVAKISELVGRIETVKVEYIVEYLSACKS